MKKLLILIAVLGAAVLMAPGAAQAQSGVNGICAFNESGSIQKPLWQPSYPRWSIAGLHVYCPARHNVDIYVRFEWKFSAWTTLSYDAYIGKDADPFYGTLGWLDTAHGCASGALYRVNVQVLNDVTGAEIDVANSATLLGSSVC